MNSYDISNFVPYDEKVRNGEHIVLVWSRATGYYFTQLGFVLGGEVTIIAREK